jgi:hypothetical protein
MHEANVSGVLNIKTSIILIIYIATTVHSNQQKKIQISKKKH